VLPALLQLGCHVAQLTLHRRCLRLCLLLLAQRGTGSSV